MTKSSLSITVLAAALALLLSGCKNNTEAPPPPKPSHALEASNPQTEIDKPTTIDDLLKVKDSEYLKAFFHYYQQDTNTQVYLELGSGLPNEDTSDWMAWESDKVHDFLSLWDQVKPSPNEAQRIWITISPDSFDEEFVAKYRGVEGDDLWRRFIQARQITLTSRRFLLPFKKASLQAMPQTMIDDLLQRCQRLASRLTSDLWPQWQQICYKDTMRLLKTEEYFEIATSDSLYKNPHKDYFQNILNLYPTYRRIKPDGPGTTRPMDLLEHQFVRFLIATKIPQYEITPDYYQALKSLKAKHIQDVYRQHNSPLMGDKYKPMQPHTYAPALLLELEEITLEAQEIIEQGKITPLKPAYRDRLISLYNQVSAVKTFVGQRSHKHLAEKYATGKQPLMLLAEKATNLMAPAIIQSK